MSARPARCDRREPASWFAGSTVRSISDDDFHAFQQLIQREAGIHLGEHKKALLVGRLTKRLRALGLDSFRDYYERVREARSDELVHMLDCICTNETHFFREPQHFEFLEEDLFPRWEAQALAGRRDKCIRAWSTACSTGEEPFSLAMALLSRFPPASGWRIEVLASDLSTRVLERARAANWPIDQSEEIPERHLKRFMLKGRGARKGVMSAGASVRSVVRFLRLNLSQGPYAVTGAFDLVFCRNVLIYFDPEVKRAVVERLLNHLAPDGHLFVGHAESLTGVVDRIRRVVPTVYAHGPQ